MKDWALQKGVKFFSHIFPMTNITAEKHDGFIVTNADGKAHDGRRGARPPQHSDHSRRPSGAHRPVVVALFERTGVLSPVELESRYEVYSDQYILSIDVEAKTTAEIAKTMLYPAAMAHVSDLVGSISGAASIGVEIDTLIVKTIAGEANSLLAAVGALESALAVHDFETTEEHMRYCAGTLRGLMDQVRLHGDTLESEVADTYWPLPKYREMLFIK